MPQPYVSDVTYDEVFKLQTTIRKTIKMLHPIYAGP